MCALLAALPLIKSPGPCKSRTQVAATKETRQIYENFPSRPLAFDLCFFFYTTHSAPPPPLSHSSRALFSPLANLRCGGLWAGPATCHVTGGQSAPFGSVGAGGAAAQILPLTSQFFLIFIFSLTSRSRRMVTCFHTFSVISARF